MIDLLIRTANDAIATQDTTDNSTIIDVIGNKSDASNTTSGEASVIGMLRYITSNLNTDAEVAALIGELDTSAATGAVDNVTTVMGYLKQLVTGQIVLDEYHDVPSADAAANSQMNEVIGNKTDTVAGDSLVALAKQIVVDTNELQTDWTNGGRLDLLIDGIKTVTDALPNSGALTSIAQESTVAKEATLGTPADTDIATDIANLDTVVDGVETKIDIIDGIVDTITAENSTSDSSGTFSYLDTGGEQDVVEITNTTRKIVNALWVDAVNLTNNGTFKVYYKVDGTNYREITDLAYTITNGTTEAVNLLAYAGGLGVTEDFKVTYEEATDEGAARDIPYSVIYETKE